MKFKKRLYGKEARELAKQLRLTEHPNLILMTQVHFKLDSVEGRTVVEVEIEA